MNRNLLRIIAAVIIGAGFLIFSLFSGGSDSVLKFNDKIVDLISGLDNSFENYMTELDNYYYNTEVDVSYLENEVSNIKAVADKARTDIMEIDIPDHDICRDFHAAAVDYVDNGMEFYNAFVILNQYIRTHNPGSNRDLRYTDDLLNPLYDESDIIFNNLVGIQEQMASQFDYELQ